jgi:hypothetical protein
VDVRTIPSGGTNRASGQASNGIEAPVVNRRRPTRSIIQKQTSMVHLLLLELSTHNSDDMANMAFQIKTGLEAIGEIFDFVPKISEDNDLAPNAISFHLLVKLVNDGS